MTNEWTVMDETPPEVCPVCEATEGFVFVRFDFHYEKWVPLTPSQPDRIATHRYTHWTCSGCETEIGLSERLFADDQYREW